MLHIDLEHWQAIKKHPRITGIVNAEQAKNKNRIMDLAEKRDRLNLVMERIETALSEYLPLLDQVYRHL